MASIIGFFPMGARAETFLQVGKSSVTAYEKPSVESAQVRELGPGEEFFFTGRRGRGFLEIEDEFGLSMYVRRRDLLGSRLVERERVDREKTEETSLVKNSKSGSTQRAMSLGLQYSQSKQSQESRELETGEDTKYSLSEFSGSSGFLGLNLNWPAYDQWDLRLFVRLREIQMEGEAKLTDSPSSSGSTFRLTQEFLSVGLGGARFLGDSGVYLLGDFEVANGTKTSLDVLAGTPLANSDVENSLYLIVLGGLGFQWNLGSHFLLAPEVRLGAVTTADPVVLLTEGALTLAYVF